MKFLIDKDSKKNVCSNTQIERNGVVGTIVLTIDSKVIFIKSDGFEDVSSSYDIAERDGCGC
jgi:hypothetical protein